MGGLGVPGGLVAGGLCASALPLIVWSVPVFGLLGSAYYMHRTWNIKDDEMELRYNTCISMYIKSLIMHDFQ